MEGPRFRKTSVLRIYTSEKDQIEGLPLYEWIAQKACASRMAGASVFRGIGSYCSSNLVLDPELHFLQINTPVVIEIVDAREKIEKFISFLNDVAPRGIMTLQDIEIGCYGRERDLK